jgi:hypothetical protein
MLGRAASTVSIALSITAVAAFGQGNVASIRPGQEISGRLVGSDLRLSDGFPFQAYRLVADSGKRYRISLTSSQFDPALRLTRVVGPITEIVDSDDDGGTGTGALLAWRAQFSGPYVLVVYAIDEALGEYKLRVTEVADPPLVVRSIAVGDSATGFLSDRSAVWVNEQATPYDVYAFRATKGQHLEASVETDSLDATGSFGRVQGGRFVVLSPDSEDSTAGAMQVDTTASMASRFLGRTRRRDSSYSSYSGEDVVTIPADGMYALRVMATGSTDSGRYVVRLVDLDAATTPETGRRSASAPRRVLPNVSVRSSLRRSEADVWSYMGHRGEHLTIDVTAAPGLDPHVYLGVHVGGLYKELRDDDDGGDGLNSRLVFVVPDSAADSTEYVIRVRDADGDPGEYTLRVATRRSVAQHLQRLPIVAGKEIADELKESDAMAEDGSAYHEWIYRAKPNERFVVEMISRAIIDSTATPPDTTPAIDSYLSVGQMKGGRFIEYSNSDDAQGDDPPMARVARVILDAPENGGEYVIRANTFGPEQHGRYTIRVTSTPAPSRRPDH